MREAAHLRQRYRAIASYTGFIVGLVGLLQLTPLLVIFAVPEERDYATGFLAPALVLVAGGFGTWKRYQRHQVVLSLTEGGVIVVLSWIVATLGSAVPFMAVEGLDATQAIFESVSGWTTTGLSVVDVTHAHATTLLWRSITQLAGGAGLAVIMLAAITGVGGPSVTVAEGRTEQLAPNVRASARLVVRIYAGYVVAGVLALRLAGMDWFEAVNHAFCAVATGGFSTRAQSIGAYDSPLIESIVIVLMLLGSLNFVTAWCLLRGRLGAVVRNGEVRLVASVIPVCAGLLLWLTCFPLHAAGGKALRVAVFESVSALSGTGYSTSSTPEWNSFGLLVLMLLMILGGGACSTAGGIKQYRIYVLYRSVIRELRRPFLPRTAVVDESIWEGEERVPVTDAKVRMVGTFAFVYLTVWLAGSALLATQGFALREALFEFASALGTVGLSVGVAGPDANPFVLWVCTVGMLLGRLEFFVIFASLAKLARDAFRMGRRSPATAAGGS